MNRGVTGKQNTRSQMRCDEECTDKWVTDDEDDAEDGSILLSHCGTSK